MSFTPEQLKENRAKWIKALRSGKYKQGKSELFNKSEKTYCCLGVLCVVAGIKSTTGKDMFGQKAQMFDGQNSVAPPAAMNFVGLRTEGGAFEDLEKKYADYITSALWDLNDAGNLSFNEIADIIEAEPKGLFK